MDSGIDTSSGAGATQTVVLGEAVKQQARDPPRNEGYQDDAVSEGKKENVEKSDDKRIRYRYQYLSTEKDVLHEGEKSGPGQEEHEQLPRGHSLVFEILTTYQTSRTSKSKILDDGIPFTAATPQHTMRILSPAVAQALRTVVTFYPSQNLSADIIEISHPYAVLVHHYDELVEFRERADPAADVERCSRQVKNAYEDLGVLLEFLDEHIMPDVREEQARNARGNTTFEWYWVAFKPGQTILESPSVSGQWQAAVVHSLSGGSFTSPQEAWVMLFWHREYRYQSVGRQLFSGFNNKWDGEQTLWRSGFRPIDLQVRPWEQVLDEIIERGKMYWNLLEKQCRWFKGKTSEFPHEEIDGLVMVDIDDYYGTYPTKKAPLMDEKKDRQTWVSDCRCPACRGRRSAAELQDGNLHKELYPATDLDLEDEQYFLLPQSMWAFVFKTRTWTLLPVEGLTEPKFDEDMIGNLVMDEKKLATIKALAKNYARIDKDGKPLKKEPWSADFVQGKGVGLSFLLHGGPGTGKTCTAECIAAYTSRPLMSLTTRDIGTTPEVVEENLIKHFRRAKSWGAVLLIDEADVFLERRTTSDLTRNSLVAGFLRALEWYEGILFLTTNRVGIFDDAFISRIHIQLFYPDFDEESRRKVWKTFIDKLTKDRGDYIRLNIHAEEYLEGNELKEVKWNGREIRNAFQTAVALAEYEGKKDKEGRIIMTGDHLKSVVVMSRDFKNYLHEFHRGGEGTRAERRGERADQAELA